MTGWMRHRDCAARSASSGRSRYGVVPRYSICANPPSLNGQTSSTAINKTHFPIGATKKAFEESAVNKFKRAPDAAKKIVCALRPYRGGADAFYQIHQLDILDKHTALIPVEILNGKVGMKFHPFAFPPSGEAKDIHIVANFPVVYSDFRSSRPLQDGDVVFSAPIANSASAFVDDGPEVDLPLPPYPDLQFTFEIAFGKNQIMDGQPIIPTLKQFIDFIESVIVIMQKRFFPSWGTPPCSGYDINLLS